MSAVGCLLWLLAKLLYDNDVVLLTCSLNTMRVMLDVCDTFSIDFDIKFNANKSHVEC
jgi:hypothetical protein